jgi:hypothetical protein
MNFKPKHLKVHVPGFGVIDKADFNKEHMTACLAQITKAGINKDEYLRKRFDIVSYDDLPLFEEKSKAQIEAEEKAKVEAEAEAKRIADEAELQAAIEAEEKAKKEAKGE